MSLSSLTYLIFLPVCVILHNLLPRRLGNLWILICSVFFYCYAMPRQALIMFVYVWIIFIIGVVSNGYGKKGRKNLLCAGIVISVVFLFLYKYLNFTISIFTGNDNTFSLIVPMGISYVTFQCIAYLAQISKGKISPVRNPVNFFTYALFFAKITAGPIEEPDNFFQELKQRRSFSWSNATSAITLIATGFLKKIAIADTLAPGVAAVFDNAANAGGGSFILAAVMYAIQIYYDFSGYTDIARGSALLFGINLTENFRQPYMATSVRDFWRRWHISLSQWLKNYIYIPLGGSRVGRIRRYLNILITFLVSGIWHGAALGFIFWGLLHGIYQAVEIALNIKKPESAVGIWLARIRTCVLVTVAWVFFRADSLGTAFTLFGKLAGPWEFSTILEVCCLNPAKIIMILISIILVIVAGKLMTNNHLKSWQVIIISVICIWLVVGALVLGAGSGVSSSFIYFDF